MSKLNSKWFILLILLSLTCFISAEMVEKTRPTKQLDLDKYHDKGNISLRVSNYGFFGSGSNGEWPSLEYPKGSSIDYLFQGALWFGAKKHRVDNIGLLQYWEMDDQGEKTGQIVDEEDDDWDPAFLAYPVIDTLVSVGFDGDASIYELLPLFNREDKPLLNSMYNNLYDRFTETDAVIEGSIREHRRGVDDDNDGKIDEDPVGTAIKFRSGSELPLVFDSFGEEFPGMFTAANANEIIDDNINIWFPLGFQDLSTTAEIFYDAEAGTYNSGSMTEMVDDDGDGIIDEDGFPISEQDLIGFYYDYSPILPSTVAPERHYGQSTGTSNHIPLNIQVRQMSYQWSYDYIKNLVYIEFDITNMNDEPLYDCAMGIYMDSDVGPQSWQGDERSKDDVSSYVRGKGFEFAYTYDKDKDGGLTTGMIGSRVCTPDPDNLEFACWFWNRGDGPDDTNPTSNTPPVGQVTSNEKYWLLTDKNPNTDKFTSLRDFPEKQVDSPDDTRYLFAFYGDMQGLSENPTDASWNLAPKGTMKIVIAVFPGETVEELKQTSAWAKQIYGEAQTLTNVVKPDTFPHYNPPEPPQFPKMHSVLAKDGKRLNVYWDNRSEFTQDNMTVSDEQIGYQDVNSALPSYLADLTGVPADELNENAIVDPETGYRLRHDFQGYSLWSKKGRGESEFWQLNGRWDKVDTYQDYLDYDIVKENPAANFTDFGGDLGIDKGLPNGRFADENDVVYKHYNEMYEMVNYEIGDKIYGYPLYDPDMNDLATIQNIVDNITDPSINKKYNPEYDKPGQMKELEALIMKNPDVSDEIYLALYDDKLIPIENHLGENDIDDPVYFAKNADIRLASRFYKAEIDYLPTGVEFYVAVTAYDRGMPSNDLQYLESGKDANKMAFFPGATSSKNMDDIFVVPNPYVGQSSFDGRVENDTKGDKSKRIWFMNLPEDCEIRIYTLAGDLVDEIEHHGEQFYDIINVSKDGDEALAGSGMHPWDMLSKNDQVITAGIYLYSVRDLKTKEIQVDKFVIIK